MSLSLYELCVPSYLQSLDALANVLATGKEHCAANDIDLDELINFRLRDDMLPFSFQVISVWHHSLGAIKGIKAGEFAPPPKVEGIDYAGLQGLVAEASEALRGESSAEIEALDGKPLVFKVSGNEIPFTTRDFIQSFSLPNFYFHATTTYTILRVHGVPLGKMDYLGALRVAGS